MATEHIVTKNDGTVICNRCNASDKFKVDHEFNAKVKQFVAVHKKCKERK